MIARILSNLTTWLIAGLLAFGVYQYGVSQHLDAELEAAQQQVDRARAQAEILLEHQRWQREQMTRLAEALAIREERLQQDAALVDLLRQSAADLERDDEATADWADRPLPGAVGEWLRDLQAGTDDGADTGDADDTAAPAEPAAGTDEDDEP